MSQARRATALQAIGWLVERHHQSLGLWPWTWTGPAGEPYVTLYAKCVETRFGDDFGALAAWVEAGRWPPLDGTPHPTTFARDRLAVPDWALRAPAGGQGAAPPRVATDLEALARAGGSTETLAQLLEAASGLDDYLATLAPLRHGGHAHRTPAGRRAAAVMRLATALALELAEDYAIPWTGPSGGHANGISDPDWAAFAARYRLDGLPFPAAAQEIFTFGQRGWLHAGGWVGDRHGNALRLGPDLEEAAPFAHAHALALRLLDG